jgi:hypothetical protein
MTVHVSGAGLRGFLLGAFSMWLMWLFIPVTAAYFLGWLVALALISAPVWGAVLGVHLWRARRAGTKLVERGGH